MRTGEMESGVWRMRMLKDASPLRGWRPEQKPATRKENWIKVHLYITSSQCALVADRSSNVLRYLLLIVKKDRENIDRNFQALILILCVKLTHLHKITSNRVFCFKYTWLSKNKIFIQTRAYNTLKYWFFYKFKKNALNTCIYHVYIKIWGFANLICAK